MFSLSLRCFYTQKNREGFPNGVWTTWSGYGTSPPWERGQSLANSAMSTDRAVSYLPVLWQRV